MNREEFKKYCETSIDHYEVAYLYDKAEDPNEFRTQKHGTMSMALAAAHFLDSKGDYTIISVTPIYKTDDQTKL